MNPWEQLLAVQAIDSQIVKLDHRSAQLPERTTLAELETELAAVRAEIVAAEADKHALEREQRRIEDECASLRERIARDEEAMYSGGSSDPGHLQDLQDGIDALKRRIAALEDEELELMEQVEPIDERLAALEGTKADLDRRATDVTAALAEADASIDRERQAALAQRAEAVNGIAPEAVVRYESVRDRLGGVAVAPLESGVCQACHLKLSAVELDRIQHLPADAEVTCEECGRFLVRR